MPTQCFWNPTTTPQSIRILPGTKGEPFLEVSLHMQVGSAVHVYCPQKNNGIACPICAEAKKWWEEGKRQNNALLIKRAQSLFCRRYYISAILVRGEENLGVRWWLYQKKEFETLLDIVLDPQYGDITSSNRGFDLSIHKKLDDTVAVLEINAQSSPLQQHEHIDYSVFLQADPPLEELWEQRTSLELEILLKESSFSHT